MKGPKWLHGAGHPLPQGHLNKKLTFIVLSLWDLGGLAITVVTRLFTLTNVLSHSHFKFNMLKTSFIIFPFSPMPVILGNGSVLGKTQPSLLCFSFTHTTTTLTTLLTPDVWGIFPHQMILCDASWVSYNLTQFWPYLPGDSIRFHRLRAQFHKTAPTPL